LLNVFNPAHPDFIFVACLFSSLKCIFSVQVECNTKLDPTRATLLKVSGL